MNSALKHQVSVHYITISGKCTLYNYTYMPQAHYYCRFSGTLDSPSFGVMTSIKLIEIYFSTKHIECINFTEWSICMY